MKALILLYGNGVAMRQRFPDNGRKSAISNLIELEGFLGISLKPQILFYGNGLAIWHGVPDITHIEKNNYR